MKKKMINLLKDDFMIRISKECNQNCVFCNVIGNPGEKFLGIKETINTIKNYKIHHPTCTLWFTGGEPTLNKYLIKLIEYTRKDSSIKVGLQTNGLRLSNKKYVTRLKKAGLDKVFIPFYSNDKKIFDKLTRFENSLELVEEGIRNIINLNIELSINLLITQHNYKELVSTIKYLHTTYNKTIKSISLSYVQPHGFAYSKKIVPKYTETSKQVNDAMLFCVKNNISFINPNCGVPLCFIPQYKEYSADYIESKVSNKLSVDCDKIKLEKCGGCTLNNNCYGIWKKYVELYGSDEWKII